MNRALCGSALSIGANVEIIDMPGYAPLKNDENMIRLTKEAAELVIPEEGFWVSPNPSSGSTDMGELCGLMPVIHPYTSGTQGSAHSAAYYIADPEKACVKSAKLQLGMLYLLLKDDAKRAKKMIEEFEPSFSSKEEYFQYIDAMFSDGDRISYNEDDTATIRL